jgi:hypothetical protein
VTPRTVNAGLLRALLTAAFLAGCSSGSGVTASPISTPAAAAWINQGSGDLVPITVSSELAVGSNRFLLNLVDKKNQPLAAPDRGATLNFYELAADTAKPAVTVSGTYMSILARLPGLYRAQVDFAHAGQWGLEVVTDEPDGTHRSGRLVFPVSESTTTPALGADAIPSKTPTATTADEIAKISTDTAPDPDFYRLSVDQALADHKPFLLIFATPAFCRSATCGPALEVVKSVAADFKDRVAFIHVEPYQLQFTSGQLQPVFDADNNPIPVQATLDWGLPSEPYAFVVDSAGKVRAKLEGIAAPEEIREALTLVAP